MSSGHRTSTGNVWIDTFNYLIDEELDYNDRWFLNFNYKITNTLSSEKRKEGWKISSKCAYASFCCSRCNRQWHSARVLVIFHYRLREKMERGHVIMRPFRQVCDACKSNGEHYEIPRFSEDKVEEILLGLLSKIKKNCYREDYHDDGIDSGCSKVYRTKPHKSSLCEACKDGICCKDDYND
ncbi:receptor-transporting protein 3-like [Protopterus annectens]|uniref:receptor-transporting protein 3-like n=1 Tax=Protopterus annectens TaxID=7888 RepID=UPI001CFB94FC|nr:receptor-transporting protein 3-like [Protopterus annectens]